MIENKFTFDEKQFEFNVQHHSDDNATFIECVHNEDYYAWSLTMNEKTNSESNKYLKFPITPSYLHKLLYQYKVGSLDKIYEFKFPEKYKVPSSNIMFELCIKLPYDENLVDTIPFFLEPSEISDSDRFNKKLLNLKESMVAEKKNELESLKDELESLKNEFVSLKNKHDNITNLLSNYVTKDELENKLENELDSFTDNDAFNELKHELTHQYATKSELLSHAAKCEFANNEMKAGLKNNYVTNSALMDYAATRSGLVNYVMKGELANYAAKSELDNYSTKSDNAATKSELANYSTKSELANYATKSELANYSTKSELANYATTSELANYVIKPT